MADKRAIKVKTLDRLAEGFQESRGITDKLTMEQMIAFAKEPVGGGENKLNQLLTGTLTEVTAQDMQGVTKLSDYAFFYGENIVAIEIPEGVTSVGDQAFGYCKKLKKITFPNSVTTIGTRAFEGCWRLEEVRLPEGLTQAPNALFHQKAAFASETGELNVYFPSTISFEGCNTFFTASAMLEQPPSEIVVDTVVKFHFTNEQSADNWYQRAAAVNMGSYLPAGGLIVYVNGEKVTNITLPSTTTQIQANAFAKGMEIDVVCEGNITSVVAPLQGVKTISFLNNTSVPSLSNYSSSTPHFDVNVLEEIRVPAALYDNWIKKTNWANWAEYIVAV